jgi:hypothetical protein
MKREVELSFSGELFGRDPRGLLQHAGLHGRHLGGDRWSVWPNAETSFLTCRDIADETEFDNHFDYLKDVPDPGINLDADPEIAQRFSDLEQQLLKRMKYGDDLAAPLHRIQARIAMSKNSDELIAIVRDAYENLRQVPYEKTGERLFDEASVQLITATDLLVRRARLPGILFRFDQDPDALQTMGNVAEYEEGFFASSAAWYREIIGVTHYFGPLLGCLSPRFWCLPAGRPPFIILFNLGSDIAGTRSSPMEPMQLLPDSGRTESTPAVDLPPAACRHAIYWWTNRLNQMFGYLCDPTLFSNAQGIYDPYEHQHWLLTLSQVFYLTTAVQTSTRNYYVQRTLTNTLLDTYADRIIERRFDQLCTYDTAKAAADRVRTRMPEDVAKVLMPLADRAVESLRRVQDGFFIRKQRGDDNVLVYIPGDENPHHRQPHRAAAILMKVFRNATHGYGGLKPPQTTRDLVAERLLAHHTGHMPDDLVFLPYLYLLDMLSEPDQVQATIVKRALARGTVGTDILKAMNPSDYRDAYDLIKSWKDLSARDSLLAELEASERRGTVLVAMILIAALLSKITAVSEGFVEQLTLLNDSNLADGILNITDQILEAVDKDPANAGSEDLLDTIPDTYAFRDIIGYESG